MRKMFTAVLILLVIAIAGVGEQRAISNVAEESLSKLDNIAQSLTEGNAQEEIHNFEKHWQKGEEVLDILTPHDDTDEINLKLSEFKSFLEMGNNAMAQKSINEMKQHFKEIQKKSRVSLTNIF